MLASRKCADCGIALWQDCICADEGEPHRPVLRPSEDEWGLTDRDLWEQNEVDRDEEAGW